MCPLSIHSLANLIPPMTEQEYLDLKEDIRKNGQIEAIWVADDLIIDGRHRYKACQELGIEPVVRAYTGDTSEAGLVSFVISTNQHRRHLSSSQLAVLALEVAKILNPEGKKRKRANLKGSTESADLRYREPKGKSSEQAARLVGTSPRMVEQAKHIEKTAPDLIEPIKKGEITVNRAAEVAARRRQQALQTYKTPSAGPVQSTRKAKIQRILPLLEQVEEGVLTKIEAILRENCP